MMKIGFFDSGLGGLYLLRSVALRLPQYDYVFLGDTKNLPYGDKTQAQIYKLTAQAIEFLFNQDCQLVIVACNTSSAQALRKIQQKYLPKYYKDRKVLGVIRPTVELVKIGDTCVLATASTVKAKAYSRELKNFNSRLKITEIAAPELVPLIESGQLAKLQSKIKDYSELVKSRKVKNLILGCTHYALYRDEFSRHLKGIKLISQDDIVPIKLSEYLEKHEEVEDKLSRNKTLKLYVTKLNKNFANNARKWFGKKVKLELARY